jgi:predicted dehydrogenase
MADRKDPDSAPKLGRRTFLAASTAFGAALMTGCGRGARGGKGKTATGGAQAPQVLRPAEPGPAGPVFPPSEVVNAAIIGCGLQGRVLMESVFKQAPGVRFQALCDIWPYSQKYMAGLLKCHGQDVSGHVYEDYREMLDTEKDLQAVIIATPDWLHAEHAIACMKAGLHVYCEKEMSNDLNQAKRMVQVAKETGRLLQIGHQRRSNERYRFAAEKLLGEAKLLGTLTHVHAQWNRGKANSAPLGWCPNGKPDPEVLGKHGYGSPVEFLNWRWYRKYGGGPICDLGSHQIDVFGWFLGATPRSVLVSGGRDYWKRQQDCGYEWYDNVRAIYEFETPEGLVRAMYQVLTTTSAMSYYESFMGTDGTLSLSEDPARCRVFAEGFLSPDKDRKHPWAKWEQKGYLRELVPEKPKEEPFAGGMNDLLKLYKASPPPVQYLLNVLDTNTYHGPHLRNFFEAVRGKEKLNCPGEVGYETAVQVLKVNQLLDAQQPVGTFREEDFRV